MPLQKKTLLLRQEPQMMGMNQVRVAQKLLLQKETLVL